MKNYPCASDKFVSGRRCIFLVLCVAGMMLASMSVVAAQAFRDVPADHFAADAVEWVSNPANGAFMTGNAANNFRPTERLTKFEAAQIYALAAGFRIITPAMSPAERAVLEHSFDMHRPVLDAVAAEFSTWNRTFDREIAFLLHRGVLQADDLRRFIVSNGEESPAYLTRQEGVLWMVRLMGLALQAAEYPLPPEAPFADHTQIDAEYMQYVYFARGAGIIRGADNHVNPRAYFGRAEMAVVFYNALHQNARLSGGGSGAPGTLIGTVSGIVAGSLLGVEQNGTTSTFTIASNAVILIDNQQSTPIQLNPGMAVTVLINADNQVISVVARTGGGFDAAPVAVQLISDEGFVMAVGTNSITIRTQRVSISGAVIDSERTFSLAPGIEIMRAGSLIGAEQIEVGDIAFFSFDANVIHGLNLIERERTITGELMEIRPPDGGGGHVLVIAAHNGASYELRVLPATQFVRGEASVAVSQLRIGDEISADIEIDRLTAVRAFGRLHSRRGRIRSIFITEYYSQIAIRSADGQQMTFVAARDAIDVYALRIGMDVGVSLDSREILSIEVHDRPAGAAEIIGRFSAVLADGSLVVFEGTGNAAHSHIIATNAQTQIMQGARQINARSLAANMNLHILLDAQTANLARIITVLP